jgi:hypothetical protein
MPPKPERLLKRVSGYADEAAAFLRRRRHMRKPFARVYGHGGRCRAHPRESQAGAALFEAGGRLIEVAGPSRRRRAAAIAEPARRG